MEINRLAFIAEWYQDEAELLRIFTLCFYLKDNGLEVIDNKTKKIFLRRTVMPELTERDFFLGSKLDIYGRQYSIIDFANEATRNHLAKYRKKTIFILKNMIINRLGAILIGLIDSDIIISNAVMVQMSGPQVKEFVSHDTEGSTDNAIVLNQMMTGPCIALEIIADDIIGKLNNFLIRANVDFEASEASFSRSLQLLLNNIEVRTGIYTSRNESTALKDLNLFFSPMSELEVTCDFENSTLAIIKPHCIKEGNLGKIVKEIMDNKFIITGLRMYLLERANCEEFYEIYRGVLQEYGPMVTQLASGNCLALAVRCQDENNKKCHNEFRQFCGPLSSEIAKLLRPHTLRAQFGRDKTLNAIHCTDLLEDRYVELEYIFKILD